MDNLIVIKKDDLNLIAVGFQQDKIKADNLNDDCQELNASKRRRLDQVGEEGAAFHLDDFARNLINSDLNICERIAQSMLSLKSFLNLDDYLESFPLELKEELESIENPSLRLSYIIDLLIKFGIEDEQSKFLSVAIKLTFKALQLSKCIPGMNLKDIKEKFFRYFRLMKEIKCEEELLSQVMMVLMESTVFKQYLLHFFLIHRKLGRLSNLDRCFQWNEEDFMTLVQHGALSRYTEDDWDVMKTVEDPNNLSTEFEMRCSFPQQSSCTEERCPHDQDRPMIVNFRCRQPQKKMWTNGLMQPLRQHDSAVISSDHALRLLWAAIPDPFLAEEDFKSCEKCRLNPAWMWYKETVLDGKSYVKAPRSLQHLSRCAIRHAMAVNFQLPRGVLCLGLPKNLIGYILLKDCVENPEPNLKVERTFTWEMPNTYLMWSILFRICMRNHSII